MADVTTTELGYSLGGEDARVNDGSAAYVFPHYHRDGKEFIPELQDLDRRYREFDKMRTDSRVSSTLRALFQPILGARWYIQQRNAPDDVTEHIAHDLNLPIMEQDGKFPDRVGRRFDWQDALYHALLSLVYGFMAFEKVYHVDEDDGLLHLRKLAPRMPHTIAKDGIATARDGGLISITQRAMYGYPEVTIPVDRLVVVAHEKIDNDWRGQSVLRPIYGNFRSKAHALEINDVNLERNGAGVVIGTGPPTEGVEEKEAKRAMSYLLDTAKNVRAGHYAGAVIPHGSKLELKGVYGTQANILGTLDYHNSEISNALLQYFANLANASHGSHAQSKDVTKTYSSSLNATADRIANTFTAHLVEDLVDRNYGPRCPAPAIAHENIGVDLGELVQVMGTLKNAGIIWADRPTEDWVRREIGLPAKEGPTASVSPTIEEGAK